MHLVLQNEGKNGLKYESMFVTELKKNRLNKMEFTQGKVKRRNRRK